MNGMMRFRLDIPQILLVDLRAQALRPGRRFQVDTRGIDA